MNEVKKRYIVSSILLSIFLIITLLVVTNKITPFDDYIYNLVYKLRENNIIDIFLKIITKLGNIYPTILIVLLLLMILKKEYSILLIITELVTVIMNQSLKFLIHRLRPPIIERLIEEKGFSYPSGHSMMALCLYGTLIYIVSKEVKNKKLKVVITTALTLIIFLIGLSRIYVRVHYPSDVLAGFILTISILIITITIYNNHFRGNSK